MSSSRAPASKQGCAPSTWERAQGSSRPCWPTWSGRPTSVPSILRSLSSRRLCRAFRGRGRASDRGGAPVRRGLLRRGLRAARRQLHARRRARRERDAEGRGGRWSLGGLGVGLPRRDGDADDFLAHGGAAQSRPVRRETDERTTMGFDEPGELDALWRKAGLRDVQDGEIVVSVSYSSFEGLWEPFTLGVGPAGAYAALSLRTSARDLPSGVLDPARVSSSPFELSASVVRGRDEVTGVLLVGARARGSVRQGARLPRRGSRRARWAVLSEAFERVMAVGKEGDALPLPFPVFDDGSDERAAIVGVAASLRLAETDAAWCFPPTCRSSRSTSCIRSRRRLQASPRPSSRQARSGALQALGPAHPRAADRRG